MSLPERDVPEVSKGLREDVPEVSMSLPEREDVSKVPMSLPEREDVPKVPKNLPERKDIPEVSTSLTEREDIPDVSTPLTERENVPEVSASLLEREDVPEVLVCLFEREDVSEVPMSMTEREDAPEVSKSLHEREDVPEVSACLAEREDVPEVSAYLTEREDVPEVSACLIEREDVPEVSACLTKREDVLEVSACSTEREDVPEVPMSMTEREDAPEVPMSMTEREDVPGVSKEESEVTCDIVVILDEKRRWRRFGEKPVGVRLPIILSTKEKTGGADTVAAYKKRVRKHSKERKRRPALNHSELCAFRDILENIYDIMEIPTVPKVLTIAKRYMNFEGSRARVRGIMRNYLGYRFNKRHPESNVAIERHSVVAQRTEYLQAIRLNDELKEFKRPVVYVGELILNFQKESTTEPLASPKKRPYKKWLIIHAGTENGFIKRAARIKIISRKPKSEEFIKYVTENLITKLPKECIVVMNNATIHNMQSYTIPSIISSEEYIKKWMTDHNIPFEENSSKEGLLMTIKNSHPVKKYCVDELLAKHGHHVLRIPPFNTDLNPIEYIWMQLKTRISEEKRKGEPLNSQLLHRVVEDIMVENWKTQVACVKKIEERYWCRHVEKAVAYEDLTFSIDRFSDTDSDSDTEYEYNHSSSSSEQESESQGEGETESEVEKTDAESVD